MNSTNEGRRVGRWGALAAGLVAGALVVPGIATATTSTAATKPTPAAPVSVVSPLPLPVTGEVGVTSVPSELVDAIEGLAAANRRTPVALNAQARSDGPFVTPVDVRGEDGNPYVVPDGMQLVIEHASMAPLLDLSGDQTVIGVVFVGARRFGIGQLTSENGQFAFWPGAAGPLDVRVGPGQGMRVGGPSNVSVLVNYSFSGYLEPIG